MSSSENSYAWRLGSAPLYVFMKVALHYLAYAIKFRAPEELGPLSSE
jgi:hypothetical protein